jgi:hypothetical protein
MPKLTFHIPAPTNIVDPILELEEELLGFSSETYKAPEIVYKVTPCRSKSLKRITNILQKVGLKSRSNFSEQGEITFIDTSLTTDRVPATKKRSKRGVYLSNGHYYGKRIPSEAPQIGEILAIYSPEEDTFTLEQELDKPNIPISHRLADIYSRLEAIARQQATAPPPRRVQEHSTIKPVQTETPDVFGSRLF